LNIFFFSSATTCSYELFVVSLLVVAIVKPTSEVGTPMRSDYVVPMMCVVICRKMKYQEGP
jgi:hypothetical protein